MAIYDNNSSSHASYVPHDLQYSAAFEDSLINVGLSPPSHARAGIRIITDDSDEKAVPGQSMRADQINWSDLPTIDEDDLPLPLDDTRRIFASPIPGVLLTHPGGYLEGGPGLDPDMDTFPDDFFANHQEAIGSEADLRGAVNKEVEASMEELRRRLRARREAREKNERIARELKTLVDQHDMEVKIQSKMAEEQKRKKEARAKRKGDRGG